MRKKKKHEPKLSQLFTHSSSFISDPNLQFVEAPALVPPEVQIDPAQLREYELQIKQAQDTPLPDEGDDDDL